MQRPLVCRRLAPLLFVALTQSVAYAVDATLPWTRSTEFAETSFTATLEGGIRIHVNAPLDDKGGPAKATRLIVYALPAGNTLEQTLGCNMKKGLDWHYDIQHIAAQTRLLRTLERQERITLVCAEAPKRFWPYYRKTEPDANRKIARLVATWRKEFGAEDAKVLLAGHSAGGSFMFGLIEGVDDIPSYIDRIAFLDSNYSFDATKHAAKIERWLKGDGSRRLIVIAYDDREITLNGKKVVGPTGGTFRATGRMREALGKVFPLTEKSDPPFKEWIGLNRRIRFYVHPNPENKILHTALVGEMNGFTHAATLGTPYEEKWGKFGGPRAFTKWLQAEPTPMPAQSHVDEKPNGAAESKTSNHQKLATKFQTQLPSRPTGAIGGTQFMKNLEGVSLDEREAAILREITSGNFPEFLRQFKEVPIAGAVDKGGKEASATLEVMPDYLAVGSDSDFVRVPMTPQTAQKIADQFGCVLPTRKMVDAIDQVGEVRLAPHPMTKDRESIGTFVENNRIIEQERRDRPLGLLVIGTKKDIVLSPRIFERPQRLAIYGWRNSMESRFSR